MKKGTKQYLVAFSVILLFLAGLTISHWYNRESTLLDVLGVESTKIVAPSICDANDCTNTEVTLAPEQVETAMQLFSQTKIKKLHGRSSIQNAYARFFFETEQGYRYELLLASKEVLINHLNDNKWYVYGISSPNDDLETLMKAFVSN